MTPFQKLVLKLLCCILRRVRPEPEPAQRAEYEALILAKADDMSEP